MKLIYNLNRERGLKHFKPFVVNLNYLIHFILILVSCCFGID